MKAMEFKSKGAHTSEIQFEGATITDYGKYTIISKGERLNKHATKMVGEDIFGRAWIVDSWWFKDMTALNTMGHFDFYKSIQ